jgi:predicted peptidase
MTLLFAIPLCAETTPLTQPLSDESETTITCELIQPPRFSEVPVFKTPKEAQNTKGTYHYKLWLPKGYSADPKKQWPCMFIMSAGGNASMGKMENYLKSNGFVVVMLVEAKNGPWEPIVGNFLAAHDDVIKRVRIAEGKKYATGQSGGARGSSVFVQLRPGFGGLILQSAGASFDDANNYHIAGIKRNAQLRIAMTMGNSDKNIGEVDRMKKLFSTQRLAVFEFNGGHEWAPADVFEKAMTWVNEKPSGTSAPAGGSGSSFDDFFKKK